MTITIIVLNALAFILELVGGDTFVNRWAAVPVQIMAGRHLETLLSSMFMHASWLHIISNMAFLWAFGPEIEDAMGRARYVVFYAAGGLVAMMAQVAADASGAIPCLGASGAIAAVMGAFLITYPTDRIRTIVFFGWFVRVTFIPAVLLIGFWLLTQLISLGSVADVQQGGVAYVAHVAGAVFGAATAKLFEVVRRDENWAGP
jgi:membrane associated rhomboid family serine protease